MRISSDDLPETRLNSLYKDFRSLKQLNEDGYIANINIWQDYILNRYEPNSVVVPMGNTFLQDLQLQNHGVPKSIDVVLDQMILNGILIPAPIFLKKSEFPTSRSNVFDWVSSYLPFKKSFVSRVSDGKDNYLKTLDLVNKRRLEIKFEMIYKLIKEKIIIKATNVSDIIFNTNDFVQLTKMNETLNVTDESVNVMFHFMEHYKKILIKDGNVIKLIDPTLNENLLIETRITASQKTILNLKNAANTIEAQINKIQDYNVKFKEYKESKPFKELSTTLQKRYETTYELKNKYLIKLVDYSANLHKMQNDLNLAMINKITLDSIGNTHAVIRKINEQIGSIDEVESLLDELEIENSKNEEINDILFGNKTDQMDKFNDEIEQELSNLTIAVGAANDKENMIRDKESLKEDDNKNIDEMVNKLYNLSIKSDNTVNEISEDNKNESNKAYGKEDKEDSGKTVYKDNKEAIPN